MPLTLLSLVLCLTNWFAQVSTPQHATQVHNHVISTSDGRISSQRLRIETPRDIAEFHETPRTGGVVVRSSGKFTPRHDSALELEHKLSIPYTPNGDEAMSFKYYCPLCMQYYKFMWKSTCCSNYICLPCTQDYLKCKGVSFYASIESHKMEHVFCPHCQTKGFKPVVVEEQESVRDYHYSYEPVSSTIMPSPLKIGESFEDLKRKMIPFKVQLQSVPSGSVQASPVLQVVGVDNSTGDFDPSTSQALMRGIAIPTNDDIPPSPSIARNALSLFGETPRQPRSSPPPLNPDAPSLSARTPRFTLPSSDVNESGSRDAVYDGDSISQLTGDIDRLTSSIPVQATPLFKSNPHRADDEMSETMEESFESLVFPRLRDDDIGSPTSISVTSPEYMAKMPLSMATNLVEGAIHTAFQHMQTSQ